MLFTKNYVNNSRVAGVQLRERDALRNAANANEKQFEFQLNAMNLSVNEGLVPRDVYQEFDRQTVERMRSDDGDTFLNDLLPMSQAINVGRLTVQYRRASDAGTVQTSMSGQQGIKMDQVQYNYDGTIIPVHDSGFFRNWRELSAQRAEGFDALIDDQRESVAAVRNHLANTFMDGHTDADGNFLVVDGLSWQGIRNDSRVEMVDLGAGGLNFDFTDNTKTGEEIKAAFISVRDTLRITNNCAKMVTYYLSREIVSNWERKFSAQYDSKTILQELTDLAGVAGFKETNKLTGNQLMGFPLDRDVIRPVVGMGMSTMALPRPMYNSDHQFVTAVVAGWLVREDFFSKTCVLYASA